MIAILIEWLDATQLLRLIGRPNDVLERDGCVSIPLDNREQTRLLVLLDTHNRQYTDRQHRIGWIWRVKLQVLLHIRLAI